MLSRGVLARRVLRRALSSAAPPPPGPNHRALLALDGDTIRPFVQPNAYVAPSASVIGSVVANDFASVMYGSVVRGDLALVHVGAHSAVLDNCTLTAGRVDGGLTPADAVAAGLAIEPELFVGDYCTVGPNAALEGCALEGEVVVGPACVVGPGAKVGRRSVLAPRTVVPPDVEIPGGELWAGSPAEKVRDLTVEEQDAIKAQATANSTTMAAHAYEFLPVGFGYLEKEKVLAGADA